MSGLIQHPVELASHQAGFLVILLLFGLPLSWRSAGPPERAAILTLVGLAIMDLLIEQFGGGSALLHSAADGIALSWVLPIALRANRFYPAIITAALLVAVLTQVLSLLGLAGNAGTVAVLVNLLHILGVLALLGGALAHRRNVARGISRPAWRNRLSQG